MVIKKSLTKSFGGVRVAHLFRFCLYEGACPFYVFICVCLGIVVSNTYRVVFSLCLSLSCVPYDASFSGL
jgi:hypothetical protein